MRVTVEEEEEHASLPTAAFQQSQSRASFLADTREQGRGGRCFPVPTAAARAQSVVLLLWHKNGNVLVVTGGGLRLASLPLGLHESLAGLQA